MLSKLDDTNSIKNTTQIQVHSYIRISTDISIVSSTLCHFSEIMYTQDIRTLDKEMRAWDAFTGLDSTVKNMVTSLRAVGELQNPAIRDRHWEQLMQATQVSNVITF